MRNGYSTGIPRAAAANCQGSQHHRLAAREFGRGAACHGEVKPMESFSTSDLDEHSASEPVHVGWPPLPDKLRRASRATTRSALLIAIRYPDWLTRRSAQEPRRVAGGKAKADPRCPLL